MSRSLISVVTVGEMKSLARQLDWGVAKLDALEIMLQQLVWIDISDSQILEAYGEIDHASRKAGRVIGKNDVWIAATARVSGATLLTTDLDFEHLHGTWIDRIWIDPNIGKTP
ncbi:PIN domain-containing protein [Singulisphaera acidiphila]|uniref:PIN domain-containing protein n=1 Tax=Singulisphaera acidiphila TaxID=466153 RepID=UPI0002E3B25E